MTPRPCAAEGRGPRLGLCCQFVDEPIRFRASTAAALRRCPRPEQLQRIAELCRANAEALRQAIDYCAAQGLGAFRVGSSILPVKTHPEVGYRVEELPEALSLVAAFQECGARAQAHDIRLTFHPDQFVVLNSTREEVVDRAIADLEYHREVAEWIGADVITLHAGGAAGGKPAALERLARALDRLPDQVRGRLAIENDDIVYTPRDLWPLCRAADVPLLYDVHHHRCRPDGWTADEATAAAFETWRREPVLHISSPLAGWGGPQPRRHHDYIDFEDFPAAWRHLPCTVEVEAKAKERAVLRLRDQLRDARACCP